MTIIIISFQLDLAQEESAMGRFLKECSRRDQTNAGKAMISVGRALSYSGQQRLALRVPLQRLYHASFLILYYLHF